MIKSVCKKTIRVNPAMYDKSKRKTVLDLQGKVIKFSDSGTSVQDISFFRRLLKDEDLIKVAPKSTNRKPSTQTGDK